MQLKGRPPYLRSAGARNCPADPPGIAYHLMLCPCRKRASPWLRNGHWGLGGGTSCSRAWTCKKNFRPLCLPFLSAPGGR
eukprot:365427-Chlamydomonas_euryale.AAC.10